MREITVKRSGWEISATIKQDGKQTVFFCRDIKGSVVWPTLESRGYFCIMGQKTETDTEGKSPLFLVSEGAEELPQELFRRLVEDSKRFSCREFFNDFKQEHRDLVGLFYDFCRYQRAPNLQLVKAPFAENISIGMMLIKAWAKSLEIPKGSLLRDQLKVVQVEDMLQKPEKFFALNALRLLMGSLEKDPWQPPSFFSDQESYRRSREKADARGWT